MCDRDGSLPRPGYDHFASMEQVRGSRAEDFCQQILATTAPFLSKPDGLLRVLDVGCGYGHTSLALASRVAEVVGIEPSVPLHAAAVTLLQESAAPNVRFRCQDVLTLEEREQYDLIVLDNVFEHLPDQRRALGNLCRALVPGGVLYILTPNRAWPIEVHYGLPFLSYLPLSLANRYLRWTGRGTDYQDASYAPTSGTMRALLDAQTGMDFRFVLPANLALTQAGAAWHYRAGVGLLRRFPWLWRIAKSFLVVGVKRG